MNERRVVCAAIKLKSGAIICGVRHFDQIMRAQIETNGQDGLGAQEGFFDNKGVFMGRHEAWLIAQRMGQIRYRCGGDEAMGGCLFSDNLY